MMVRASIRLPGGHKQNGANRKEHVDLPQLTDKAHAGKNGRGGDNSEGAQNATAHLVGHMTDHK